MAILTISSYFIYFMLSYLWIVEMLTSEINEKYEMLQREWMRDKLLSW